MTNQTKKLIEDIREQQKIMSKYYKNWTTRMCPIHGISTYHNGRCIKCQKLKN